MSELLSELGAQLRDFGDTLAGADSQPIVDARRNAFARLETEGLPSLRHEDWKYTDIRAIREATYVALGAQAGAADSASVDLSSLGLADFPAYRAVFVDGVFCAEVSNLDKLPNGIAIEPLKPLLDAGRSDIVAALVKRDAPFASLNAALVNDGLSITVEAEVELDKPIHAIFVHSARPQSQLNTARLNVQAERNSRCCVVESHCGLADASGMTNALTELSADDGAIIKHYRVQIDNSVTHHIGNVFATVGRDAEIETCSFAFGGGITRVDVTADLIGGGANAILNGLFLVNDDQHIDHHTRINHMVGNTHSSENYKGIADGNGRGVFNGKIFVAQDAQKIEALQSSKNLLLSDAAEIDTKPELEIYADDVKCAHGATVGQLDSDSFFYLRSRGIDEQTARSMLTFAFAADIAADIQIDSLRSWLEERIVDRTHVQGINEIDSDE